MSTGNPFDSLVFNPFSVTTCQHCGAHITQPKNGGRPRRYCDKPGCRKAGSRIAQKQKAERDRTMRTERLRRAWLEQFDVEARNVLEDIFRLDGLDAAERATIALKKEISSRERLWQARRLVEQAESRKRPVSFSEVTPGQVIDALLAATLPQEYYQQLYQLLQAEIEHRPNQKERSTKVNAHE